ncbi:hypothetical protein [Singulisphaera acidiphila]|uniref:Uncharacterized protein n=1 Tax=Singulisphaera acidiphila (strain ATCC BAA-1392 / DSM 18658 / VKM B-2454 / MOB10) TaxID=886293 RepID=L0DHT7_SINAD|nr:hypothetical protein [Singulisphaera acidiphila]AGA28405.1 hypothetical protein Sinac_4201 [Singulisphaera acidiphila DSM 18658]
MNNETLQPFNTSGWVDTPARHAVASTLGPEFAIRARNLMGANADKDLLLFKAWKDLLGSYPKYVAQKIGDCTSFASGHNVDLTQAIEIVIGGENESYKETSTEALYGAGRELANMLGGGDGCYGSALAKAVTTVGVAPREAVGEYSGQRAKQWGHSGTPADIKKLMNEHKMGSAALVVSLDELDAALANGYPVTVCSNQGFTMSRDTDGFCSPQGSWAHAMLIAGKRITGRKGYLICQSWGSNVPSGPLALDQPDFSFWVEPNVIARMLAVRDSFAFSKFAGYPGRPLPSHWTYDKAA